MFAADKVTHLETADRAAIENIFSTYLCKKIKHGKILVRHVYGSAKMSPSKIKKKLTTILEVSKLNLFDRYK